MIEQIYQLGLEKCAGDEQAALEFTQGFLKEAGLEGGFGSAIARGAAGAIGAGAAGLAVGLGIHGISSALNAAKQTSQREKFEQALAHAIASNELLRSADQARLHSFAETMFKFAPSVCADSNLLVHVLASAVHGESMDMTTIRSLADLESRIQDTKKNALFTPKVYS